MNLLSRPLAVSLGDPAGIGPEIIAQAWVNRADEKLPAFFVVGGAQILAEAARVSGLNIRIERITTPAQAMEVFPTAIPVLGSDDAAYAPGQPDQSGAHLALHSLVDGAGRTAMGEAAALVTAPISKTELAMVGFTQPGQTEFLADACGKEREDAVMMLAGPSLRAVPLTVHCALQDVSRRLTKDLIIHRARIVDEAMKRDFGFERPRIAVCGLNPHAGENGRFGDEEQRIITPAVDQLECEGLDISGPHPGDALFSPRAREKYDVALAMYHDQALIPLKALDFDEGVNVTLGLPIVRTSPDHGTAFDIAGQGRANAGAMVAALRMAGEIAARRATHG